MAHSIAHSASRFIGRHVAQFEIACIRLYQSYRYGKYTHCRYIPRCDVYAVDALQNFGIFRANLLLVWRILRCNPWGGKGYDPIPETSISSTSKKTSQKTVKDNSL